MANQNTLLANELKRLNSKMSNTTNMRIKRGLKEEIDAAERQYKILNFRLN